jgi:hypothetical protein
MTVPDAMLTLNNTVQITDTGVASRRPRAPREAAGGRLRAAALATHPVRRARPAGYPGDAPEGSTT